MTAIGASLLGLDVFRQFYQVGESVKFSFGQGHQLIDKVTKVGVTALDFLSTYMDFDKLIDNSFLSKLNVIEGGLRWIEIGRSLFLLYTNPPGIDRDVHKFRIFSNILNVARISLQILQSENQMVPYAKLTVCTLDAVSKFAFLCYRCGPDLIMRATVEGLGLFAILASDIRIMMKIEEYQSETISFASIGLLAYLAFLVEPSTSAIYNHIHNHYHLNQSPLTRELCKWTFAVLTSAPISMAAMVGCGLSKSILDSISVVGRGMMWMGPCLIAGIFLGWWKDKSIMSWKDLAAFNHYVAGMVGLAAIVSKTY